MTPGPVAAAKENAVADGALWQRWLIAGAIASAAFTAASMTVPAGSPLAWALYGGLLASFAALAWGLKKRRASVAGGEADAPAARNRLLFDEAPVGIALLDLSGTVVEGNPAFLKLLGASPKAVVGHPFAELFAREDFEDVTGQLSKLVMGTQPGARIEGVRLAGSEVTSRTVTLHVARLAEGGEPLGLVVHLLEESARPKLDSDLAHAQKMQAVGQLAGGIAHDFNNLLTAMLGFCDLLLTRHGPGDSSFEDIVQIRANAIRASNLVRQLLAFSRKQTLEPVVVDVASALTELSTMLRRLLGATIELRLELGSADEVIITDPGQFDQVILNLAVNARDAMPGGGTLTIRTDRVHVPESMRRGPEIMPAGSYVLIEVSDTGVGIPKEIINNIFEPFFSTKGAGQGTGLGLSTVYGIVRQSEGFVFVDSAPGRGATFSIYLPAVDHAPVDHAPGDHSPGEPPLEKEAALAAATAVRGGHDGQFAGAGTVLLVEDEDPVRMFAARALRGKGYEVLEATSGEAALDMIAAHDGGIDVMVSDVVMPGMDGYTLARLVHEERSEIRIILVSGHAEGGELADFGGDPSFRFLAKPFTLAELAATVKETMEQ
jgi:two-component system cell cycle sensor histidine kinase/response regulator CckA